MTQILDVEYANELLEVYMKAVSILDEMAAILMRRIPYELWPENLKICGFSDTVFEYDNDPTTR